MVDRADTLRLRGVDDPDLARWHSLIERDPEAHALHKPEVQKAVAGGIRGARPHWLEVEDESGELIAGLPLVIQDRWGLRKVVSGASGLYGGPLMVPGADYAMPLLARAFLHYGGWRTARRELVWRGSRQPVGGWDGIRPLPTSVLRVDPAADFEADYEEGLRPARRKERRRLLTRGYRVTVEGKGALVRFYPIYAARCLEWGTTAIPLGTLIALLECGDEWKAFVVRDETERVRGAHICIDLGDELFAWLGTTDRVEGGSLATLLIEAELRWCHTQARGALNLGTSADLSGVADFKRGIQAAEDPRWILRWQRVRGDQ